MRDNQKQKGFNFLAPFYDALSSLLFGGYLHKSQVYFLPQLRKCNSVLIFGGGTGKILVELLQMKIGNEYTYADISSAMIRKTKKRIEKYSSKTQHISFIQGSYSNIPAGKKFDLIVTPFVLDCLTDEELSSTMKIFNSHLNTNGEWLFTDFHHPEKGSMKLFSKIILRTLYFFFNLICRIGSTKLPDFSNEFSNLNYRIVKEKYFLNKLLVTRIYERQE